MANPKQEWSYITKEQCKKNVAFCMAPKECIGTSGMGRTNCMNAAVRRLEALYCDRPKELHERGWDVHKLYDASGYRDIPSNFSPQGKPNYCVPLKWLPFVKMLATNAEREASMQLPAKLAATVKGLGATLQEDVFDVMKEASDLAISNILTKNPEGYKFVSEDGPVYNIQGNPVAYTYIPSGSAEESKLVGLTYKSKVMSPEGHGDWLGAPARWTDSKDWDKFIEGENVARMQGPEVLSDKTIKKFEEGKSGAMDTYEKKVSGTPCRSRTGRGVEDGYWLLQADANTTAVRGRGDIPSRRDYVYYVKSPYHTHCSLVGRPDRKVWGEDAVRRPVEYSIALTPKESYLAALTDVEKKGSKSPYFIFSIGWTKGSPPIPQMISFAKESIANALMMFRAPNPISREAYGAYLVKKTAEQKIQAYKDTFGSDKGIDTTCWGSGFNVSVWDERSQGSRTVASGYKPVWNPWTRPDNTINFYRGLPVCEDAVRDAAALLEAQNAEKEFKAAKIEIEQLQIQILQEAKLIAEIRALEAKEDGIEVAVADSGVDWKKVAMFSALAFFGYKLLSKK